MERADRFGMAGEAEAELRRAMITAHAACLTLIERLDQDDIDQLALAIRAQEMCDLLLVDLNRYSG